MIDPFVSGNETEGQKVDQLREALQTISVQKAKLDRLYHSNTRMLSIIGHDLRGPLGTIKSMLEMFSDGYITEAETKEIASKLAVSYKFTEELLDNLIFWARRQFDGKDIEFSRVDLRTKIEECFTILETQAEAKGNVLVNNIPKDFIVETEPNILHFILRNLLNNANKFSAISQILVNVEKRNDLIVIEVRDSGVGIPAEKLSKLFNWDSKMSTYGTSGEKGSGLGLSMSQEFAEKLGGHIEVKSKVGEGTSFFINIKEHKVR